MIFLNLVNEGERGSSSKMLKFGLRLPHIKTSLKEVRRIIQRKDVVVNIGYFRGNSFQKILPFGKTLWKAVLV
jgi:hypothetical protein